MQGHPHLGLSSSHQRAVLFTQSFGSCFWISWEPEVELSIPGKYFIPENMVANSHGWQWSGLINLCRTPFLTFFFPRVSITIFLPPSWYYITMKLPILKCVCGKMAAGVAFRRFMQPSSGSFQMMQNLLLEEGGLVQVESVNLQVATYSKFQPQSPDFLDITNPKAVYPFEIRRAGGRGYSSAVENLPSMCESLVSIPFVTKRRAAQRRMLWQSLTIMHLLNLCLLWGTHC